MRPRFTDVLEELPATTPFVAPDALERRGAKIAIRLGANENAFGVSPAAAEAMRLAAGRVHHYGDPESHELREALAARHAVAIGNLVVGSGIDDLLGLVVRAHVQAGTPVVASLGSYPTFAYHVRGHGGALETVPYADDANDLEALAARAAEVSARVVYLANPDNPSGSWLDAAAVEGFLRRLPNQTLLVLDEAYAEFAPSELPRIDAEDPRVIRLRTFSKAHGMAGARIGYGIASTGLIAAFEKIRLHFGVNAVAQAGALAAVRDPAFAERVVAQVAKGRAELAELARRAGATPLPSATNFVTIDVGGAAIARALVGALLERGVFIRMPGAPPLDRCVRVTVGTSDDHRRLAPIFAEALADVRARAEKI